MEGILEDAFTKEVRDLASGEAHHPRLISARVEVDCLAVIIQVCRGGQMYLLETKNLVSSRVEPK